MSNKYPQFDPLWFLRQREQLETSCVILEETLGELTRLGGNIDKIEETQAVCHQLWSQAGDFVSFLIVLGVKPHESSQRQALYNHLYLLKERSETAVEQTDRLVEAYFTDQSPHRTIHALERALKATQTSALYLLRWVNHAIEQLDEQFPR